MANGELVAVGAGFCLCYSVFLVIILAVGILSRLDPVSHPFSPPIDPFPYIASVRIIL